MKKIFAGMVVVGLGTVAVAQPVNAVDIPFGLSGPYATGAGGDPASTGAWFTFSLDVATNIDIDMNRTSAPPDLFATLFSGDVNGFDATAEWGDIFSAGFSGGGGPLTFVDAQDDTHDDAFGGPFGDPQFIMNLGPGDYSMLVFSLGTPGEFTVTSNIVPAPGAFAILGLGGLLTTRRSR
jgi:hypothetical protein